ncbi:DoxX family protein [Rhodococcus rhodochrous]|uniref:DoxX family protein n=1 Tax=Rhodococcus rhodochrous TaxID=1829 RepID=UPI0006C8E17D|nr:DoxX family protein [Rhodococcus rhodochrous]
MNDAIATIAGVLAGILAVTFSAIGAAKVAAIASMRERAAHLGFDIGTYRRIGVVELAGALGLLAGWVIPGIGAAAAGGLMLLLAGAVVTHARSGDTVEDMYPALILGAAAAVSLILYAFEASS